MGTLLEAVTSVLADSSVPLNVADITERVLAAGLWQAEGKTPAATVESLLAMDVLRHGEASIFVRTAPRMYRLRAAGAAAPAESTEPRAGTGQGNGRRPPDLPGGGRGGARRVGRQEALGLPGDHQAGDRRGMLAPDGLAPEATMESQLLADIQRRARRGDPPRFLQSSPGTFALAKWTKPALAAEVAAHNADVRRALHAKLVTMEPHEFERLVARLLDRLGFTEMVVTRPADDDGVDVLGTLVVGDVMRTRMAVHVRRSKGNLHSAVVREIRGPLGPHDQGLIVTTSDFSPGARLEASKPDHSPVGLMNGMELVALLLEHEIGVTVTGPPLYELAAGEDSARGLTTRARDLSDPT